MLVFMFIKRGKYGSVVLLTIWLSVPAAYAYIMLNNYPGLVASIAVVASAVFMVFSIFYYNGNARLVTVPKSKSKEVLEQFDLEKVAVVSGIWCFLISLITFHGSVLVSYMFGEADSCLFIIVELLVAIVMWSAIITSKICRKTD